MPVRPPLFRPHPAPTRRAFDAERTEAKPWRRWYWTARWKALARAQLAAQPLCVMCEASGIATPATVCDHVRPHRGDAAVFWGGPFQSLCASCHSGGKQRAERAAR